MEISIVAVESHWKNNLINNDHQYREEVEYGFNRLFVKS